MDSLDISGFTSLDNGLNEMQKMIQDFDKSSQMITNPEAQVHLQQYRANMEMLLTRVDIAKELSTDTLQLQDIVSGDLLSKASLEFMKASTEQSVKLEVQELNSLVGKVRAVNQRFTQPEVARAKISEIEQKEVPSDQTTIKLEALKKKVDENEATRNAEVVRLMSKSLKKCDDIMVESAIERIEQRQLKTTEVDICFMIDGTVSMRSWIQMTNDKIQEILAQVQKIYSTTRFRLAVVIYRDFDMKDKSFQIQDFVEDCEIVKDFLSTVEARGGDDIPEDVYGGFRQTLEKLVWKSSTKLLIHIGDAPCHRKRFHNEPRDRFPESGTDAEWQNVFDGIVFHGIDYYFMEINTVTRRMFGEFKKIWQNSKYHAVLKDPQFKMHPISADCEEFARSIGQAIEGSYRHSLQRLERSTRYSRKILEHAPKVKLIDLNWDLPSESWNLKSGKLISYKVMSIEELLRKDFYQYTTEFKVNIQKEPFSNGTFNVAYAAKIPDIDFKVVAKRPIDKFQDRQLMIMNLKKHYIAASLAKQFNDELLQIKDFPWARVYFIYPFLLDCGELYTLEGYIAGDFTKYTNNLDFLDDEKDTQHLSAFAHYSYIVTKGEYLVCDFQGVNSFLLTDPSIHTRRQTYMRSGDFGLEGMINFFSKHQCNDICRGLGLYQPSDLPNLSKVKVKKWVEKNHQHDSDPKLKCRVKFCNTEIFKSDGKFCSRCHGILQLIEPTKCRNNNCQKSMNISTYKHMLYGKEPPKMCPDCKKYFRGKQNQNQNQNFRQGRKF